MHCSRQARMPIEVWRVNLLIQGVHSENRKKNHYTLFEDNMGRARCHCWL
jgi:hypothetical protein